MAGVTDSLIKLAREVSPQPSEREMDSLLATGEQSSMALVAMAVNALGGKAISLTGAEAGVLTDRAHTRAKIANVSPKRVHELLSEDYIVVVAGFQGQTVEGDTTTLGRGGSDLTAIALAGALNADACQIFTDVDGVFTCDPRVVAEASKLGEISYDELLEMAGAGSKVMQSRAVEFAKKFSVPFEVRSSFNQNAGTIAKEETANMEDVVVRGISIERKQAKVTLDDVPDDARRGQPHLLRHLRRQHHGRYDRAKRFRAKHDRSVVHDQRRRPPGRRESPAPDRHRDGRHPASSRKTGWPSSA